MASLTSMPGCFLTLTADGGAVGSINSWVTPAGDWSSQLFAESNLGTQVVVGDLNCARQEFRARSLNMRERL